MGSSVSLRYAETYPCPATGRRADALHRLLGDLLERRRIAIPAPGTLQSMPSPAAPTARPAPAVVCGRGCTRRHDQRRGRWEENGAATVHQTPKLRLIADLARARPAHGRLRRRNRRGRDRNLLCGLEPIGERGLAVIKTVPISSCGERMTAMPTPAIRLGRPPQGSRRCP